MNKFDRIRSLDGILNNSFKELDNINPTDVSKNIALFNLIKGFKLIYKNIHEDLLDPYYEEENLNIEDKIIERLEGLFKIMSIIVDFEDLNNN
jgi:hypothetical protein